MIAWSWCLTAGFQAPSTYFYVIYFGTLLLHEQMRDDAKCSDKYGETGGVQRASAIQDNTVCLLGSLFIFFS